MYFESCSVVSFCATQYNLHGQEFVHDLGIILRDYNDGSRRYNDGSAPFSCF